MAYFNKYFSGNKDRDSGRLTNIVTYQDPLMGRQLINEPIIRNSEEYGIEIMSFQTNINGTFNPIITTSSGTLTWIIGGNVYNTNTPSVELSGEIVDVKVYSGSVLKDSVITNVNFEYKNIIGTLDFSWFTLNITINNFSVSNNDLLSNIIFSNNDNIMSGGITFGLSSLPSFTGVLDLRNVTLNCTYIRFDHSGMSSILFKDVEQSYSIYIQSQNMPNITSLDLHNFTSYGTYNNYSYCPNLSTFLPPKYITTSPNLFIDIRYTKIETLDLSNSDFQYGVYILVGGNNYFENLILNNTSVQKLNGFDASNCGILTSLDFSNCQFVGTANRNFSVSNCALLNSVVFNSNVMNTLYGNTVSFANLQNYTGVLDLSSVKLEVVYYLMLAESKFSGILFSAYSNYIGNNNIAYINTANCTNITSLDLSSIDFKTTLVRMYGMSNLSNLTWFKSITTKFNTLDISNCALNTSSIDNIFASLNAFFSSNIPISNLTVSADQGTNSSPTGGRNNTDIVNLDTVVFPNAGYDFIYSVN